MVQLQKTTLKKSSGNIITGIWLNRINQAALPDFVKDFCRQEEKQLTPLAF